MQGVFLKDPSAKDFVRSGVAVIAGWKILHGHMAKYTAAQCYAHIEGYVDGDDAGLTRQCMRLACRLPADTADEDALVCSDVDGNFCRIVVSFCRVCITIH